MEGVAGKSYRVMVATLVFATALLTTAAAQDISGVDLQDIDFNSVFSLLPSKNFNANDDVDRILKLLSRFVPNRASVPDIGTDMNIQDCFLEGLSSGIVRAGDVAFNLTDQRASFSFGLAVNDIFLKCSWKRKVSILTLVGTARADVDKVGVSAAISVNLQPGAHPTLDEFNVLHFDEIKTTFTGLGFLNQLAGKLADVLIRSSRERIITELEGDVAQKLQAQLRRVKVPQL